MSKEIVVTTTRLITITTDIHQLEFLAGVTRTITVIPRAAPPIAAVYS